MPMPLRSTMQITAGSTNSSATAQSRMPPPAISAQFGDAGEIW